MVMIARPPDCIEGYRIEAELRRGPNAISYRAVAPSGKVVFLKQHSTPTHYNSWYHGYVAYEREIQKRLRDSDAGQYCLVAQQIFEVKSGGFRGLYQAFDYVEDGEDLKQLLEKLRRQPIAESWQTRLTISRVVLAALEAVSKVGIVHGDLKPENIHLIRDASIAAKYRPRLIDMDMSILTDLKPPWDGADGEGYVGTANYFSPEHMRRPIPASDVFTASLIIHELLCKDRPYPEYRSAFEIMQLTALGQAPLPALLGSLGHPEADLVLCKALRAALACGPDCRPQIGDLRRAVLGKALEHPLREHPLRDPPGKEGAVARPCVSLKTLVLRGNSGAERRFNIATPVGRLVARMISEGGNWLPDKAFHVRRVTDGGWEIVPDATAFDVAIVVNGSAVSGPVRLCVGDQLLVKHSRHAGTPFAAVVDFA